MTEEKNNNAIYVGLGILATAVGYLWYTGNTKPIQQAAKVVSDSAVSDGQAKLNTFFEKEIPDAKENKQD